MDFPPSTSAQVPSGYTGNVQPPPLPLRRRFEPFFFNPRLKLAALRLSLLCSAAVLGTGVATLELKRTFIRVYLSTLAFVFLHHVLSAFKIRFFIRLLDFILIILEITVLVFVHGNGSKNELNRFTPTGVIVIYVAGWGLTLNLFFLFLCRLAAIIRHKGKNLLRGFDLLEDAERIKGVPIANCPAAYSLLIGRSIWRIQFKGEGLSMRLIRGFIAGSFITAVIAYSVIALIIKPVKETALVPVKESRGDALSAIEEQENRVWNFAFSRRMYKSMNLTVGLNTSELFHSAITVTPLWDDRVEDDNPPCVHLPDTIPVPDEKPLQIIHVRCPGRVNALYRSDIMPDILIEVNYELLRIDPTIMIGMFENVVGVYPGFTENPLYLTRKIQSIPLPPSAHYLANVGIELRRVLKHPALSALGMFETSDTFSIPRIGHIVPDPQAFVDPPVYNMSSFRSTFRIYYNLDTSEIRIFEDDREKSILGGFSAIGGLWTFLGGVFALFFGTSLMKIFFDTKELSMFGIAQQLEKDKITRALLQEYPQIRHELNLPPSQRGMMAMLQDHMVDVELFRDTINDIPTPKEVLMTNYDVGELGSTATMPQPHHIQSSRY